MPIPAGTYTVGCTSLPMCADNPERRVAIPQYKIDRLEVRDVDYVDCETSGACPKHWYVAMGARANDEVAIVSVQAAIAYCAWKGGHVPSDMEWEIAGRGGDARLFPWGNTWTPDRSTKPFSKREFDIIKEYPRVGTRPDLRSRFGVEDMSGNSPELVLGALKVEQRGAPSRSFRERRGHTVTSADYSLVMIHDVIPETTAAFRCAF